MVRRNVESLLTRPVNCSEAGDDVWWSVCVCVGGGGERGGLSFRSVKEITGAAKACSSQVSFFCLEHSNTSWLHGMCVITSWSLLSLTDMSERFRT